MVAEVRESITSILERVFKDNYEIIEDENSIAEECYLLGGMGMELSMKQYIHINIHYDEIEIKNETGYNIVIKDAYIKFFINSYGALAGSFLGACMSPSANQFRRGFSFAHGGGIGHYHTFCLGDGPLNQIMQGLMYYDRGRFEGFLVALKAYLEFENNVERTHIYHFFYKPNVDFNSHYSYPKELIDKLLPHVTKDMFTVGDNFKVVANPLMSTELVKHCESQHCFSKRWMLPNDGDDLINTNSHVRFKGKLVPVKIIKSSSNYRDARVHPQIIEGICRRLENKIVKKATLWKVVTKKFWIGS